ncbi:winged-helix domain-containing protein [Psychrobacter sp. I-STPA10]|uniref:winged-helix domain-containing protein n=1 Tax=Psychrobacter sp. I-STPA10 TaxID=2585769 RepID=UPI001E2A7AFD|nr:winged-helix domain-containing protein [Psychrobacter sp. I-STPA10]
MSTDNEKYINSSQQRALRTLKALFGHEFTGISSKQLAQQLDTTASQVFKDLINLQAAGLAEQLPDKNWRIAPLLGREAIKVMHTLDSARRRLDETANRYGVAG